MLRTHYVKIPQLQIAEILRMHAIFQAYYDHGPIETFLADLGRKDGVFLVRRTSDEAIVGFSTLAIHTFLHQGRTVRGLFSGDTVIEKEYWGSRTLQAAFARKLLIEAVKRPFSQQYWLLISKGYKTYLLLTRNFPIFYPDRRQEHPGLQDLVVTYCERLFPGRLDRQAMVLDFGPQANCLRGDVADIDDTLRRQDPDIAFFDTRNPGWRQGMELPCIARTDLATFVKAIGPFVRKALRDRVRGTGKAAQGSPGTARHRP